MESVLMELDVKLVRAVPAVLDSDLLLPLRTLGGRMSSRYVAKSCPAGMDLQESAMMHEQPEKRF